MKKMLIAAMSALAISASAQTTVSPPETDCQELFFSEIVVSKVSQGTSTYFNYAVEVFNPTTSPKSLTGYALKLSSASGAVNIPLSGTIGAHGVHVVTNTNAQLPLLTLANQLSDSLDFITGARLELTASGAVIDRIGQTGTPSTDTFNVAAFFANPAAYLASFNLNLNDFQNVVLRRGLFVTKGDPVFADATALLGKWGFFPEGDFGDLGQHRCLCNKPTAEDWIGYWEPTYTIYAGSPTVDPLSLNVNGTENGLNFVFSPNLTHTKISGSGTICNDGSIPFPDFEWNWYMGLFPCNSNSWTYVAYSPSRPSVRKSIFATTDKSITLKLSSTTPGIVIDFASPTHVINLVFPSSLAELKDADKIQLFPTVSSSVVNFKAERPYSYSAFNLIGQEVGTSRNADKRHTIDISSWAPGVYTVLFTNNNGQSFTEKIIKE